MSNLIRQAEKKEVPRGHKKSEIIQALAEDAPTSVGQDSIGTSASIIETALNHAILANQPSKETIRELVQEVIGEVKFSAPVNSQNGTGATSPLTTETVVSWSQVPEATADVNGEYVTPPWWDELVIACQVTVFHECHPL